MIHRYLVHLWQEMSATGRRTFPWDLARGAAFGVVLTFTQLFALYVAIRFFDASETQKSLIASASFMGLLLSLFYASWSPLFHRNTLAAALPWFGSAAGLGVAAVARDPLVYTLSATFAGICTGLPIPIITGIYRTNYRSAVRGQVFGIAAVLTTIATIIVGKLGSGFLDVSMEYYRLLFGLIAVTAALAGAAILMMPSTNIRKQTSANAFECMNAIRENPLFGRVLLAWFLFGFANLIMLPQRIEYLADEKYGFALSAAWIGIIVLVLPEATKLVMIPLWARLFDRFNFIRLRIVLNCFLVAYFILYYFVPFLWAVIAGSMCLGAMFGGGAIAWNLWVTKFSPPEETSRYMTVHTFLTGVRGSMAPAVGYALIGWMGIKSTAFLAIALTLIAIGMLFQVRNAGERQDG